MSPAACGQGERYAVRDDDKSPTSVFSFLHRRGAFFLFDKNEKKEWGSHSVLLHAGTASAAEWLNPGLQTNNTTAVHKIRGISPLCANRFEMTGGKGRSYPPRNTGGRQPPCKADKRCGADRQQTVSDPRDVREAVPYIRNKRPSSPQGRILPARGTHNKHLIRRAIASANTKRHKGVIPPPGGSV